MIYASHANLMAQVIPYFLKTHFIGVKTNGIQHVPIMITEDVGMPLSTYMQNHVAPAVVAPGMLLTALEAIKSVIAQYMVGQLSAHKVFGYINTNVSMGLFRIASSKANRCRIYIDSVNASVDGRTFFRFYEERLMITDVGSAVFGFNEGLMSYARMGGDVIPVAPAQGGHQYAVDLDDFLHKTTKPISDRRTAPIPPSAAGVLLYPIVPLRLRRFERRGERRLSKDINDVVINWFDNGMPSGQSHSIRRELTRLSNLARIPMVEAHVLLASWKRYLEAVLVKIRTMYTQAKLASKSPGGIRIYQ